MQGLDALGHVAFHASTLRRVLLVQEIVAAHGGQVTVESMPGQGISLYRDAAAVIRKPTVKEHKPIEPLHMRVFLGSRPHAMGAAAALGVIPITERVEENYSLQRDLAVHARRPTVPVRAPSGPAGAPRHPCAGAYCFSTAARWSS